MSEKEASASVHLISRRQGRQQGHCSSKHSWRGRWPFPIVRSDISDVLEAKHRACTALGNGWRCSSRSVGALRYSRRRLPGPIDAPRGPRRRSSSPFSAPPRAGRRASSPFSALSRSGRRSSSSFSALRSFWMWAPAPPEYREAPGGAPPMIPRYREAPGGRLQLLHCLVELLEATSSLFSVPESLWRCASSTSATAPWDRKIDSSRSAVTSKSWRRISRSWRRPVAAAARRWSFSE